MFLFCFREKHPIFYYERVAQGNKTIAEFAFSCKKTRRFNKYTQQVMVLKKDWNFADVL
jgi:hypothetical protein